MENTDSDISVFDNFVIENGMKFYMIPVGYPLFKASKMLDSRGSMSLENGRFYFFGLKNMGDGYIEQYEKIYGIIFDFITTQPLKLIAMDDPNTVNTLYENARGMYDIQNILDKNYGYRTGKRDSVSDKDRMLSQYLCDQGYDGYAIKTMQKDDGGTFHTEFMICNATSKTRMNGRITSDEHVGHILHAAKIKELEEKLEEERKRKREEERHKRMPQPADKTKTVFSFARNLFGNENESDDDDMNDVSIKRKLFGGRRRTNKQQRKTQAKKQIRNRKTRKYGKKARSSKK